MNNTVVPMLGWDAIFKIQGGMSILALILLFCFSLEKTTFIPFDDERPFFERKLSFMPEVEERESKRKSKLRKRRSKYDSGQSNSSDNNSTQKVNKDLLAGQKYE